MGCDIHIAIQTKQPDGSWARAYGDQPECFDSRNYNLFGILADVRNGTGFAGILTGEPWPSIAADRGLPPDFDSGDDDLGDHSFTWIGLEELKAFDWDGTVRRQRGCVAFPTWREWQESQAVRPKAWCGFASGGNTEIITPEAALERTTNIHDRLYVESSWSVTAREATYDWPGIVIPFLEQVANGSDLRLVFGFDS